MCLVTGGRWFILNRKNIGGHDVSKLRTIFVSNDVGGDVCGDVACRFTAIREPKVMAWACHTRRSQAKGEHPVKSPSNKSLETKPATYFTVNFLLTSKLFYRFVFCS